MLGRELKIFQLFSVKPTFLWNLTCDFIAQILSLVSIQNLNEPPNPVQERTEFTIVGIDARVLVAAQLHVMQTHDKAFAAIDRIKSKLEALLRYKRRHWIFWDIFGAAAPHGHRYKRRPVLSSEEINKLEQNFGVALPEELKLFLTHVHGGGIGPGYGFYIIPDPKPLARRRRSFPFNSAMAEQVIKARMSGADRWATLDMPDDDDYYDDDDDEDYPGGPGFIPLAHHGCGVFDVLVTVGEQRGVIWCCDMEWSPVISREGGTMGFLAWYEDWLDACISHQK